VDLEGVVGAAGVPEKSVSILTIFVASTKPLVDESGLCFFGLIPIAGTEGIAFHPEVADFVGSGHAAGFVRNLRFKSRKDFAAGARPYCAGPIGNDHVKAFGGTESVEDFHAEALTEAIEERSGERLACGNRVANAGEIEVGTGGTMMIQERGVVGGHGKEKGGAVTLDIGVNAARSRASGRKNCRGAAGEREVACVAETVGEEEACDAEAAVALVDSQNGVGVVVRADHHIVMKVHAAFGHTGGTGRIEPEGRVIFSGGVSGDAGRGGVHQIAETRKRIGVLGLAGHDYFAEMRQILARNGLELGQETFVNYGDGGAGIVQHVLVVVRFGLRVDRNGDGANFYGTEE